jgi:cell division protein ZipA
MKNDLSPASRHQFSLANLYQPGAFTPDDWESFSTTGLTLFMSVPCAHGPTLVFDKMLTTAQGLCEALHGDLLDQENRPLTNKGTAVIRHQIKTIDAGMRAHGIAPGSETALRLFRVTVTQDSEMPALA